VKTASNIYNFSDYREFLKDRYRQLKETDPAFSFRTFSKQAGFGSPNYLKLVMDGKRNLSSDAIGKFAVGLRLDNHETEFFKYMVECTQCTEAPKKQVYEAKLLYLRELFKVKSLIPELYDYYHDWYHAAIRRMIGEGKIENNPASIAENLVPAITEEQAKASIELLTKIKFIEVTEDNCLKACEVQAIDKETEGLAQKIHYEQMAELAAQSIYTQGPDTQDFESLTLNMPAEKVQELRQKIQEWVLELSEKQLGGAVYQLNIQLFALTKPVVVITKKEGLQRVA
jgi:uncharacterized protein (TIGR02147 family)